MVAAKPKQSAKTKGSNYEQYWPWKCWDCWWMCGKYTIVSHLSGKACYICNFLDSNSAHMLHSIKIPLLIYYLLWNIDNLKWFSDCIWYVHDTPIHNNQILCIYLHGGILCWFFPNKLELILGKLYPWRRNW
jgi:hypothetical protein